MITTGLITEFRGMRRQQHQKQHLDRLGKGKGGWLALFDLEGKPTSRAKYFYLPRKEWISVKMLQR
jgi:hypothetical protein